MSVLEIKGLNKAFGGLQAINDIDMAIEEGELSAIIGPNGAGKTTLFNLITGHLPADSGKIFYKGKDILGLRHYQIVRMGIGRAFQRTNIFPNLSVFKNVQVALISYQRKNFKFLKSAIEFQDLNEATYGILGGVNLTDKANIPSSTLAHGDQKLLDIAVALALEPDLLLLDEPTSGMSSEERRNTVEMIRTLWEKRDITLVFIEHDMDVVFSISQKIRVLHHGELIAEGIPEAISKNELVIEAYLGEEVI
jgi:branched-chain amino acid transport system ATP-binding protein